MDWNTISWQDRAHFFGLAARLMRRTLVDHARRHRTGKRGAGAVTIAFDEASVAPPERTTDLVAIDDALNAWRHGMSARARLSSCGSSAGSRSRKRPKC